MKTISIFVLIYMFSTQISFSQNFKFKISSESPVFHVSFPAEPELKNIVKNQYTAKQYSVFHNSSVYSFSVLTIPDSIEDKQLVMNSIHLGFKQSMDIFNKYEICLNDSKICGMYYEGISKKVNTLARFHIYFHKNYVFFIGLSQTKKIPSKKQMEKFMKTIHIE